VRRKGAFQQQFPVDISSLSFCLLVGQHEGHLACNQVAAIMTDAAHHIVLLRNTIFSNVVSSFTICVFAACSQYQ